MYVYVYVLYVCTFVCIESVFVCVPLTCVHVFAHVLDMCMCFELPFVMRVLFVCACVHQVPTAATCSSTTCQTKSRTVTSTRCSLHLVRC